MIAAKVETYSKASDALEVRAREIVAFVGGGGKTSLMFAMASELRHRAPVLSTTTTKIFSPEPSQSSRLVLTRDRPDWESAVRRGLEEFGHVTMAHYTYDEGKLKGHEREEMDELLAKDLAPYVLIEADGARKKPLKASRLDEPLTPRSCTLVVGIIGWDCIGRTLDSDHVHRVEIFRNALGLVANGIVVTEEILEAWIVHPDGLRKNVPDGARFALFLNKCDSTESLDAASAFAQRVLANADSGCRLAVAGSVWQETYRAIKTP